MGSCAGKAISVLGARCGEYFRVKGKEIQDVGYSKYDESVTLEEQFFLQRVIMHSSLIFIPRASSPNDLLRHLELCSQVLTLYCNIARQIDKRLSLETWEVFLKVERSSSICLRFFYWR